MQKQSARNLVVSPKIQAAWGTRLADANLLTRQRFNPSTVFEKMATRRSDQMASGKGTEFATNTQITAWDTKGTLTTEADAFGLGWMLALLFGVETVTGAGPYTHAFTIPTIDATMSPTTLYVEETNDQKFYLLDMCASSLSLTVPERGSVTAAIDMLGTGRWTAAAFGSALPALIAANYLLGSDVRVTASLPAVVFNGSTTLLSPNITGVASLVGLSIGMAVTGTGIPADTTIIAPLTGTTVILSADATVAATNNFSAQTTTPFVGRQKSLSIKVDRQAKPFESSGDGLYSSSVASGYTKFAVDVTVAANQTDDVNGWFENQVPLAITIGTNPLLAYGFSFTFPSVLLKANKLGNTEDKVMWGLAFDETSCLQVGATPAIGASIINDTAAFLVPA
jgi:hypothetical protein